ncbi:DUF5819 family protein [Streptomyces sp. NPDC058611]|uniref:DUF5819 family protein n=1 Tax=unclassified Streptomyces TaxID=2593676 RepID=UPI0036656CAC
MGAVGTDRPDTPVTDGAVTDDVVTDRSVERGPGPGERAAGPPAVLLKAGVGAAVVACLATALVHVVLVFLHVAPPNPVSQLYGRQVHAWVFPLFEQNWRLFAPDPESVNRQISARTVHTAGNGTVRVSGWVDLTAVDNAAVTHHVIPSHTTQNMLRRAWTSYLETHGTDDRPHSQRARMMQEYLRNIAADRVAAREHGAFESLQLRVTTLPIAPAPAAGPRPASTAPRPVDVRYLPWWKAVPRGN